MAGLELIAARVAEREIDCDFRRRAAYTYSEDPGGLDALRAEVEAMRAAGLDAELVDDVDLPWDVAGAVRLDGQAEFHPRRFLLAIAAAVARRRVARVRAQPRDRRRRRRAVPCRAPTPAARSSPPTS